MPTPVFDQYDQLILNERKAVYLARNWPQMGHWLRYQSTGEMHRVAHLFNDGIQPSYKEGDSFYLAQQGFVQYSGGLLPFIGFDKIRPTGETKEAGFWFFHHDRAEGDNSVECSFPVPVWLVLI